MLSLPPALPSHLAATEILGELLRNVNCRGRKPALPSEQASTERRAGTWDWRGSALPPRRAGWQTRSGGGRHGEDRLGQHLGIDQVGGALPLVKGDDVAAGLEGHLVAGLVRGTTDVWQQDDVLHREQLGLDGWLVLKDI